MHVNNVLALNTFRSSIPVFKMVYSTVVDAIVAKTVYSTAETQKQAPEVFLRKGALRNFTKFTEKHMHQSLFLIKLQACHKCRNTLQ